MAEAVYILCAVAGLAGAILLARGYRRTPSRLLLWSCICFAALALNSVLVAIDLLVLPQYDLRTLRLSVAASGIVPFAWALATGKD